MGSGGGSGEGEVHIKFLAFTGGGVIKIEHVQTRREGGVQILVNL